jgi:hypothetical protein
MVSEWIEIRIVFDPSVFQLVAGVGKQTFQQIEGLLDIAQERINAGDIVLRQDIVRVDGQGSRGPFSRAIVIANGNQRGGAEISWPRVFRVKGEFILGAFNAAACGTLAIFRPAQ